MKLSCYRRRRARCFRAMRRFFRRPDDRNRAAFYRAGWLFLNVPGTGRPKADA